MPVLKEDLEWIHTKLRKDAKAQIASDSISDAFANSPEDVLAEICGLRTEISKVEERIRQEQEIGRISGSVYAKKMYRAGRQLRHLRKKETDIALCLSGMQILINVQSLESPSSYLGMTILVLR